MILAVIQCDICGRSDAYNHVGKTHIIRWSRKKGWSIGKTIKCPLCKANKISEGAKQ